MSVAVDISNDLETVLNQHEFSMPFTAKFEPVPRWDIKAVRNLEVFIFPDVETRTRQSRDTWKIEAGINVGFMAHVEMATRREQVKALLNLVEEVAIFISDVPLPNCPGSHLMRYRHSLNERPYYFWEHLQQYSTFTSVLNAVFMTSVVRYGRT